MATTNTTPAISLKCSCGSIKHVQRTGQDLQRAISDTGWLSLPGEPEPVPAVPNIELLPESLREAAKALPPTLFYPAKCSSCT